MLDAGTIARPQMAGRQAVWSLDAWAAIRPAMAFRHIATRPSSHRTWLAFRRPLFITLVLACGISMLSAGVVTPRIAFSVFVYWAYVPLTEMMTVAAVTWRMKSRPPMAIVIDRFFIGHAPSTLLLLALVGVMTSLPFDTWWALLTGPLLSAFALVTRGRRTSTSASSDMPCRCVLVAPPSRCSRSGCSPGSSCSWCLRWWRHHCG